MSGQCFVTPLWFDVCSFEAMYLRTGRRFLCDPLTHRVSVAAFPAHVASGGRGGRGGIKWVMTTESDSDEQGPDQTPPIWIWSAGLQGKSHWKCKIMDFKGRRPLPPTPTPLTPALTHVDYLYWNVKINSLYSPPSFCGFPQPPVECIDFLMPGWQIWSSKRADKIWENFAPMSAVGCGHTLWGTDWLKFVLWFFFLFLRNNKAIRIKHLPSTETNIWFSTVFI